MLDFSMLIPDLNIDSVSYFAMKEEEEYNKKQELEDIFDSSFDYYDFDDSEDDED